MLKQKSRRTSWREHARHTQYTHGRGRILHDHLSHGAAQAAEYGMLFNRDNAARFSRRTDDGLLVNRTHRRHVYDARMNTAVGEQIGRVERAGNHRTVRQQRDVIARAQAYNDTRASPSTFVALVAANRAALLGRRYYRQQCLYGRSQVSLDEAIGDDDGASVTRGDLVAETDGYAAWMGQSSDPLREAERRLDLRAAAQLLPDHLRGLCDALRANTASGACRSQNRSRADLYRCLRELRLRFRAAGLAGPA